MTTPRPWTIVDKTHEKHGGYIEIRGPNNEAILTMFPHAGNGGVGIETALDNARWIIGLVNEGLGNMTGGES